MSPEDRAEVRRKQISNEAKSIIQQQEYNTLQINRINTSEEKILRNENLL